MKVGHADKLTMRNYFHPGESILIHMPHRNYKNSEVMRYKNAIVPNDVTIGASVCIRSRVVILSDAELGYDCIALGGALVSRRIQGNAIVGSKPAQLDRYCEVAFVARQISMVRSQL